MAEAIGRLETIDPRACRESAAERYDVSAVAAAYEEAYCEVISLGRREAEATRLTPAAR